MLAVIPTLDLSSLEIINLVIVYRFTSGIIVVVVVVAAAAAAVRRNGRARTVADYLVDVNYHSMTCAPTPLRHNSRICMVMNARST